jgi:PTH2 family peptidyl-tRNA hydrolase
MVRSDLAMTPGKAASQAGHAFLSSYLRADPDTARAYVADGGGTKVVLAVPDEPALWQAYKRACDADLPCALWTESGHVMPPTFDGSPIVTAVGIGPADRSRIKPIVSDLRLMT